MIRSTPRALDRVGSVVAVSLLVLQGIGVLRMLWADDRFFSWAPHDMRTDVRIEATHAGRAVAADEIQSRYGQPRTDWHAWANVLAVVRAAETRRPPAERWHVTVRYHVNLGPERVWVYPDSARSR